MAILDIILLLCFIPAIIQGVLKGFVQQVTDIIALIAGAWAAFYFSGTISAWLCQYLNFDPRLIYAISFIVVAVVAVLILHFLGNLLCRAVKMVSLGWLNRTFGVIFGTIKTALILGLLIMAFNSLNASWHLVSNDSFKDAAVYNFLKDTAETVWPFLKDFVSDGTQAIKNARL